LHSMSSSPRQHTSRRMERRRSDSVPAKCSRRAGAARRFGRTASQDAVLTRTARTDQPEPLQPHPIAAKQ
jgi:hypothetical protein